MSGSRSPLHRPLLILAWLLPLGILVQAALAGQAWFVQPDLMGLHGGVGHGVLTLAVIAVVLSAAVFRFHGVTVLSVLVLIGLVGQTGLGYAGHRGGVAMLSSIHIPVGVALLGLSVALAVLVSVRHRPGPRTSDDHVGHDAEVGA